MDHMRPLFDQSGTTLPVVRVLRILMLGAAMAMPAAHADVIDFENIGNGLVGDSEQFQDAGYLFGGASNVPGANPGDLVGAVIDGSDPGSCGGALACPVNNPGNYYAALNDGILFMGAASNSDFSIESFDASFIGTGAPYGSVAGLLRVQGFMAAGGSLFQDYLLAAPDSAGFAFQHFTSTGAFAAGSFTEVAFFGFTCNTTGSCTAFNSNQGQFALDNITAAVPEPSSALMLLLGLAGIGPISRRRGHAPLRKPS